MGGVSRSDHGHRHALVLIGIFFAILLTSCKTKYVYLPVRSTTDSIAAKYVRDSVILKDSVIVMRWTVGDTNYIKERSTHSESKSTHRVDSFYVFHTDSVPYPVYVDKEVAIYRLRWWQKPLVWLGGLSLFGIAVWWIVRARKRV